MHKSRLGLNMKIDIPYYIRQVLREQRKVYIPDVGTFAMVQTPASFSQGKKGHSM